MDEKFREEIANLPEKERLKAFKRYLRERWAREWRKNAPMPQSALPRSFVAVDFETLYSQRVSACSIGMVKYKEGEIADRYYSLIRPPKDYPGKCGEELTWIHGFRWDDLKDEKTFAELHDEIEQFVEGLPLVAHNACVEQACFRQTTEFYGIKSSIRFDAIHDTLDLAERIESRKGVYEEGRGMHTLDAVCRRFSVPTLSHHNALDDAEMCGNLFVRFGEICEKGDYEHLELRPKSEVLLSGKKYNEEDVHPCKDMDSVQENPFKDKHVCLTGFPASVSQEYGHVLSQLGAHLQSSVSGKTEILICGNNAGPSKLAKAKEIGAQIMSEQEFLELKDTL